jgi:metallo-beta-lactamase family protein
MCEAGRIRHHLKHNLWRKESTILFVGYQTAGTLGRTIWEGAKSVSLFGEEVAVRAEICTLSGISGHADRRGLQQWLKGFVHKPRAVFVNHGDEAAVTAFADLLGKQGYTAYAPHSGTVYDLLAGKFQRVTRGVPVRRAAAVHAALVRAAEDLLDLVKKGKRPSQKEQQALTDRIRALIAQYKK